MSLFAELRRRNVFRVGIAYLVGAWLLLQLADVLSELLNLPDQVGPVVVAAVVIGLPIALFAAWAFELTPEGIRRESEVDRSRSITPQTGRKLNGVITVMLALAVAYLLFDKFWLQPRLEAETPQATDATQSAPAPLAEAPAVAAEETEPPPATETAPISRQSVAVLPFENRSPVAGDEFFIDGIHDDLLTTLARIGGLKVISRTSVSRYEGSDKSIPEIARELGVATVMEGAVQRAGDTVRINVQLIDAQTDEHLWAEFFDRDLTADNLFAIQTEITEKIAEALEARLTPDEERRISDRPTDNLEAYSAYLRGMRAFETREVGAMQAALADFQHAVELDPDFALGWAGIAQVAEVLPSWGGMARDEAKAIAVSAAQRAMELAPDSGEANLALAMVLEGDEAVAQFAKAVDMLPNHAMAHQWYANALQGAPGPNWLQALELLRKAEELDPLSPNHRTQVARQLSFMNRFDEAERQLRVVLESNPDYAPAIGFMGWISGGKGDLDQSIVWTRRYLAEDPGVNFPKINWVANLANLQDRERLQALAAAWEDEDPASHHARMARLFLALLDGRYDAIIELAGSAGSALTGPVPIDANFEIAWASTYARDYAAALAAWQKAAPALFDEAERETAIRRFGNLGCTIADVARRAGETEFADRLARETTAWVSQELPKYQAHAANAGNLAYCLAYQDDFEGAMDQLETNLRHRHFDLWFEPRKLELFDPLRGNPRFESVMQAFEDEMARQRASLDRLEAEFELGAGT